MSPIVCTCGRARPSAVVNADIRRLVSRLALSDGERERLAGLWAEWQAAVAREQGLAA